MRIILFFDLPRNNSAQNKAANLFVKEIKKAGFFMLQESVYCKLLLNQNWKNGVIAHIKSIKPSIGNVIMLTITEKQYNSMDIILGKVDNVVYNDSDRMILL